MTDNQRHLVVLPNISVSSSVDLGKWALVSSRDLDQFPKKYHAHVTSFANMYHTVNHPVHEVGILLRRARNKLRALTDQERKQADKVIDALIFASCYRNRFRDMARDNFAFTVWTFPGNKKPSDMVNLAGRRFRMQVVENKPHLLQIPQHVFRQSFGAGNYDSELLAALLACVYSESQDDQNLMHALYWFNLAHADSDDVTEYTRFAMTAAAFEALLDTPRHGVTEYFKKAVQLILGQSVQLETWAGEFYKARSDVVHGNELPELMYGEHKHRSMLALADTVFSQCVYRLLSLRNYWPGGHSQMSLRRNVVKDLVSNKERFTALRHFMLDDSGKKAQNAQNVLYEIQKYDVSVDLQDCDAAFEKLIYLALEGLKRLARMNKMKTSARKEIIREYRAVYNDLKKLIREGHGTNVFQSLQAVEGKEREDIWDDAAVRGEPFGQARRVNLDSLHNAMYDVEDLRTNAMYS